MSADGASPSVEQGGDVLEVHAATMESPIGTLTVAVRAEGVVWVGRENGHGRDEGPPAELRADLRRSAATLRWVWEDTPDVTAPVIDAFRRYFLGEPEAFKTIPVAPVGTPFQLQVWESCHNIPFGETRTYGDLAASVGKPQAARAIGGAMNRNPVPLIVPCHRVVGADGHLTGYGMGGTGVKQWLLDHEMRARD